MFHLFFNPNIPMQLAFANPHCLLYNYSLDNYNYNNRGESNG